MVTDTQLTGPVIDLAKAVLAESGTALTLMASDHTDAIGWGELVGRMEVYQRKQRRLRKYQRRCQYGLKHHRRKWKPWFGKARQK